MMKKDMTQERFEEIVSAYGANPSLWPEGERSAAIDFASSNSAQSLIQKAEALDLSLSYLPDPAPISEQYLNKLLDIPNKATVVSKGAGQIPDTADTASDGFLGGITAGLFPGLKFPQLAGIFTACMLGIILGTSNIARYDVSIQAVDASAFIYSSPSVSADLKEFN